MAFGVRPPSDAMSLLLSLLLILAALSASSAAPMSAAAASAAAPALHRGAHGGGFGATLGGGLGAGFGGKQLSELAEMELDRYAMEMLDPASDSVPVGTVTRRITAKSVFIAPSFSGHDQCAEGYQQDEMGRCIKVVKADAEKSWDLLLDKLNSQFGDFSLPLAGVAETTPPPGPPPGPFQLAIPIADSPEPELARPAPAPVPAATEQATETVTEEEEEVLSTTTSPTDEDTETPATTRIPEGVPAVPASFAAPVASAALVPEVVMLTSEEQPHSMPGSPPSAQEVQAGAYLVNESPTRGPSAPAAPGKQSDSGDANPILNTVNSSPLVSGVGGVHEPMPSPSLLVADASSVQPATAFAASASPSTTAATTIRPEGATSSPATSSTTTASSSSSPSPSEGGPESEEEDVIPTTDTVVRLEASTLRPTITSTPTTPSTPLTSTSSQPPVSSTSSWLSSAESRPSSSNLLRPSTPSRPLAPVFAADAAAGSTPDASPSPSPVRFPVLTERPAERKTERPTLFRTQTGFVRFPSVDVTFPMSPGDANRLQVDKPVVFPKDEKASVWWPPLPPAPSFVTNWGLEQTRNRPVQQHASSRAPALHYRYWSRSPSRLNHGVNTLSTSGGSSSSSSSSSSASQESSQALRRTLSYSHSHRGGSGSLPSSSYRGPSHRRGRDW